MSSSSSPRYKSPPSRSYSDEREAWSRQEARLLQRAPKCRRVYDAADALRRAMRRDERLDCSASAITRAVEAAFAGPCKRARQKLARAVASCRRMSPSGVLRARLDRALRKAGG
jgi:hypothetical protein